VKETPSVQSLSDHMKLHPIDLNSLTNREASPMVSRREMNELKQKVMGDDGDISTTR